MSTFFIYSILYLLKLLIELDVASMLVLDLLCRFVSATFTFGISSIRWCVPIGKQTIYNSQMKNDEKRHLQNI